MFLCSIGCCATATIGSSDARDRESRDQSFFAAPHSVTVIPKGGDGRDDLVMPAEVDRVHR